MSVGKLSVRVVNQEKISGNVSAFIYNFNNISKECISWLQSPSIIFGADEYLIDINEDGHVLAGLPSRCVRLYVSGCNSSHELVKTENTQCDGYFFGKHSILLKDRRRTYIFWYQVIAGRLVVKQMAHFNTQSFAFLHPTRKNDRVQIGIDNDTHIMLGRYFFMDNTIHRNAILMYNEADARVWNVLNLSDYHAIMNPKERVYEFHISFSSDVTLISAWFRIMPETQDLDDLFIYRYISEARHTRSNSPYFTIQKIEELTKHEYQIVQNGKRKNKNHKACVLYPPSRLVLIQELLRVRTTAVKWQARIKGIITINSRIDCIPLNSINESDYGFSWIERRVTMEDKQKEKNTRVHLYFNPLFNKIYWMALYHKYRTNRTRKVSQAVQKTGTDAVYLLLKNIFDVLPPEIVEIIFSYVTDVFRPVSNEQIEKFCKLHEI